MSSTVVISGAYLTIDGERFQCNSIGWPEAAAPIPAAPISFSMNFYPAVPSRIRRMTRRRQKIAITGYLTRVFEEKVLNFTGLRTAANLHGQLSSAFSEVLDDWGAR